MRDIKKLSNLIPILVGFILMLNGCETVKRTTTTVSAGDPGDPVSLVVLSEKDVRAQYGRTFMENPYISPSSSILPTYNDYVVVKLNFNTMGSVPMIVQRAEVTDDRGKDFASFMTREKFEEFAMNQSPDQANNTLKRNMIGWYYLPQTTMTLEAGKHSYLIVMVGRHPIPDTATIHIDVSLNNVDRTFDIPVPITNE
jgi:hypothetical protein